MPITASVLRADVYRLLDRVIQTGEALEVERHGVIVRVIAPGAKSWVERLPRRVDVVEGDPDDLVHIDWSTSWTPDPA